MGSFSNVKFPVLINSHNAIVMIIWDYKVYMEILKHAGSERELTYT